MDIDDGDGGGGGGSGGEGASPERSTSSLCTMAGVNGHLVRHCRRTRPSDQRTCFQPTAGMPEETAEVDVDGETPAC